MERLLKKERSGEINFPAIKVRLQYVEDSPEQSSNVNEESNIPSQANEDYLHADYYRTPAAAKGSSISRSNRIY